MVEGKKLTVEDIKKLADGQKCPVQKALFYIEGFLDGPMCGKCFPCEMGTYEAKLRLKNIIEGHGTGKDLFVLKRIASDMLESSRCKRGKDTAAFILEWMGTEVFKKHIEGRCPDRECLASIEYRIIPEDCNACGLCKDVCKFTATHGEKTKPFKGGYFPFEIRQKRCTKCGECIKVCPTEAIIIVDVKSKELVGI